jgi:hypothetical protein
MDNLYVKKIGIENLVSYVYIVRVDLVTMFYRTNKVYMSLCFGSWNIFVIHQSEE